MGLLSMCEDITGIAEHISAMHWIADSGPGIGSQRCIFVCMYVHHAFGMPVTVCAWARGKVIGSILSVRCRHHEITRSQVLRICVCCMYNESIDIDEKLVYVRFKWLKMAY